MAPICLLPQETVGEKVLCIWRGEALNKSQDPIVLVEGYNAKDKHNVTVANLRLQDLRAGNHDYEGILIHGGKTLDVLETEEFGKSELSTLGLPIALATPKACPEFDEANLERLPSLAMIVHTTDGSLVKFLDDPVMYKRSYWGISGGVDTSKQAKVLSVWRGESVGAETPLAFVEGDGKNPQFLPVAKIPAKLSKLKDEKHGYKGLIIHGGKTLDVMMESMTKDELGALRIPVALATAAADPEWDLVNLARLPDKSVIIHQSDGSKSKFLEDPQKFVRQKQARSKDAAAPKPRARPPPHPDVEGPQVMCIWRGEAFGTSEAFGDPKPLVYIEGDCKNRGHLRPTAQTLEELIERPSLKDQYQGILINGGQTIDVLEKEGLLPQLGEVGLPIALGTLRYDDKWDPINLARLPPGSIVVVRADGSKNQFLKDPEECVKESNEHANERKNAPAENDAESMQRKLRRHIRGLSDNHFDDEYHHVYSSMEFDRPPPGTVKLALNVARFGKDDWLDHGLSGSTRRCGDSEWKLAYHGTDGKSSMLLGILREGLKRRGGRSEARVGAKWGEGVYVSPDPSVAFTYCDDPLKLDGRCFHLILECRVRPGKYRKTFDQRESWVVKNEDDVRVCALLLLDSTNVKCRHGKFWVNCCMHKLKGKDRSSSPEKRSRSRKKSKEKRSRSRTKSKEKRSRSRTKSKEKTGNKKAKKSKVSSSSSSRGRRSSSSRGRKRRRSTSSSS